MARKGNQQKNGLDHHSSKQKQKGSDSGSVVPDIKEQGKANTTRPREEPLDANPKFSESKRNHAGDESNTKQRSGKFVSKEKQGVDVMQGLEQSVCSGSNSGECVENVSSIDASGARKENGTLPRSYHGPKHRRRNLRSSLKGLHFKNMMESAYLSDNVAVQRLRMSTISLVRRASVWLEKQRPYFILLTTGIMNAQDYLRVKFEQAYPVVLKWLFHLGNIILLLSMVWLDCTLRGIDSFLRMGTTSFFSVVWCGVLSIIAMIGIFKFLMILAVAVFVGLFIGFIIGVLVLAISGIIILWLYGSFWTTSLIILLGGLSFMVKHERLALLITTTYSVYCAWAYVGWLGVILGLNLSFISSDALIYFLKNNISQQRRPGGTPEQAAGMHGRSGMPNGDPVYASFSETRPGSSADRGPGVPSTSGTDSEITSEDEVIRLLNCSDHYSALGLSRYEDIDASLIKREYRKKAMLVHPDKNMGNEKAAEAFKKLQNAYEILLDSLKRKEYDDELRREELLNYFRRFQGVSQKSGGHGFFASGFTRPEGDSEDPVGDSRRIACKKCGDFHVWVHTKKTKFQARWCQDCKDFHQAKDGDGWVEQSSQPLLFGLMQKVDAPSAYVCADSRIYDATEWYICQGMRCPANTHKPSFHVNTSVVTAKSGMGKEKRSSVPRGSGRSMPASEVEETMTEEEFLEWLQNAVQSGMFDNFSGDTSTDNPSPKASSGSKSSASKRKKKGKKW